MTALYICLSVFISAILILFAIGYIIFYISARRRRERPDGFEDTFRKVKDTDPVKKRLKTDYDWFEGIKKEDITVISHDGLKLFAELLRVTDGTPKGTVILFHGYRSSARRDFCLQIRILHDAGYHVIAVHQRSHKKSEGKYLCYGLNERRDAILWVKKAKELFGKDMPLALMGLSMGGATVLMASGLASKNDPSLRCVVADCPFSSPWDIISEVVWAKYKIYPYPVMYFTNFWFRVLAKCDLRETSSADSAAASHLPILIFHGDNDTFVLSEHSKKVHKKASLNTKLVLIPDADHAQAIFFDEELYKKELLDFLSEHM